MDIQTILQEAEETGSDVYDIFVHYDCLEDDWFRKQQRSRRNLTHYEACKIFKEDLIVILYEKEKNDELDDAINKTIRSVSSKEKLDVDGAKQFYIVDALSNIGIEYNPRTRKAFSFYKEEFSPSMHVYEKTNTYYCFATRHGGDVIQLIMDYFNIPFIEAVKCINNY